MSTAFGSQPLWGSSSSTTSYYNPQTGQYDLDKPAGGPGSTYKGEYATTSADPWGESGGRGKAINVLKPQIPLSKDPSNIYRDKLQTMMTGQFSPDDPSYAFRFQQGQQATERMMAANKFGGSGNMALALQNYGQQAASQEYGAQFGRMLQAMTGVESQYSSQMERLMRMAGVNDPSVGVNARLEGEKIDLARQGQSFSQSQATAADQGIGDAINRFQDSFFNLSNQQQDPVEIPDFSSMFADSGSYDSGYSGSYSSGGSGGWGYVQATGSSDGTTWGGAELPA